MMPPTPFDQQRRPDQVGRHLKDMASEEGALQRLAQFRGGQGWCGVGRGNAVLSHFRESEAAKAGGIDASEADMLGNIGGHKPSGCDSAVKRIS